MTTLSMSRFSALVSYVWRACLPRKRLGVLAIPCGAAVLFGLMTLASNDSKARAVEMVTQIGVIGLVLPLGALVIGDAVLGSDVKSGVLSFTWLTPARFGEIVIARWLGGTIIACLTLVPASMAVAIIGGVPGALWPMALAVGAGSAAHIAVFVLIGAATSRSAVWSLAYIFLGERLLGSVLTGIAQVSPTWEAQQVFASYAPEGDDYLRDGIPHAADALVRLGLLTAGALALATWALSRIELTGARD